MINTYSIVNKRGKLIKSGQYDTADEYDLASFRAIENEALKQEHCVISGGMPYQRRIHTPEFLKWFIEKMSPMFSDRMTLLSVISQEVQHD